LDSGLRLLRALLSWYCALLWALLSWCCSLLLAPGWMLWRCCLTLLSPAVRLRCFDCLLAAAGFVGDVLEFQLSGGDFARFFENSTESHEFVVANGIPRLFQLFPGSLDLVSGPALVEGLVLPLLGPVRAPLLVEQDFRGLVFDSLQTRPHLALGDESGVLGGEVDGGLEVHEVLAAGHGLGLLEVRAVRQALDLVLRVLRVVRHPHRRVHLHLRCFQLVVNLVHVLFKPSNFVTFDDILVERKDDLRELVLGLFL
jgi:hypothetical protein